MSEAILSTGTIEAITIVESIAIEITGPLTASVAGGVAIGAGIAGGLVVERLSIYSRSKTRNEAEGCGYPIVKQSMSSRDDPHR